MKTTSKSTKVISILLAGSIILTSCASTTMIQSNPSGAKLFLNGDEYAGKTPYTHRDTKIVGSTTTLRLEKEGYKTFNGTFSRNEKADVGAIIGGFFLLVPFLWIMKYEPSRTYELMSIIDTPKTEIKYKETQTTKSKADQLRKFKELLDEGVITQEEFNKEKRKILEEK